MIDAFEIMSCHLSASSDADTLRCQELEKAFSAKYSQTLFGSFEDQIKMQKEQNEIQRICESA